ncbi:MAG TPA: L-threonylcarbamoyladenylate synthase [Dehalococcoidia bacterium]|nr:L-threonylcarbamoyladenylate synthase [Dehalococcoidia bacterium]
MARIVSADADRVLAEAVAVLRGGGLVAYPSDTVYGLGAAVSDGQAVERVFAVKDRDTEKALSLLLADAGDLASLCAQVPFLARVFAQRYWPGPLTLVLRRSPAFHSAALGGGDTVAVRMPDHPFLRELIRALGEPITGTSANRSGRPACRSAQEVERELGDAVDLIIDGGASGAGPESTVVSLTGSLPTVLREGAIPRVDVERLGRTGIATA